MQLDINLIPWREHQRQRKVRYFVFSCGLIVAMTVLMVVAVELYLQSQVSVQQSRIEQLNVWDDKLDHKVNQVNAVEKEVLLLRADIAELKTLHAKRYLPLQLVVLLSELLPETVYLDQIDMLGRQVSLTGVAATTEQVDLFLANLQNSPLVSELRVQSLVNGVERFATVYQSFSVTFKLVEGHLG